MSEFAFQAQMLRTLFSWPSRSEKRRPSQRAMFAKRGLMLVLLAGLIAVPILTIFGGMASADGMNGCNDSSSSTAPGPSNGESNECLSLYSLSSNASSWFSNVNSPGGGGINQKGGGGWDKVTQSGADGGDVLGYIDQGFSFSVGYLISQVSGSSNSVNYSSLVASDQNGNPTKDFRGAGTYARFGAALQSLGFDGTSSGFSLGGMFRFPMGFMALLGFTMCALVSVVFRAAIQMLTWLNPFRWFYDAIHAISPAMANGMTGGHGQTGIFAWLANVIDPAMRTVYAMSWTVVVPLLFVFLLMGMFFSSRHRSEKGARIKRFCIRVLFIGVGLPLCGAVYSHALTAMKGATAGGDIAGASTIMRNYVDFDGWMNQDRLAIPPGAMISWNNASGQAGNQARYDAQCSAELINAQVYSDLGMKPSCGNQKDPWNGNPAPRTTKVSGAFGSFGDVWSVLSRYMTGTQIDASDFETAVKSDISSWVASHKGQEKTAQKWFTDYSDNDPSKMEAGHADTDPVLSVARGTGLTANRPPASGSGDIVFSSPGVSLQNPCGFHVASPTSANPAPCNLSVLSAYNYLNTSFGPSSMTIYSSDKSTSGFTRAEHNSVDQVGTGLTGFLDWLRTVLTLFAIAIVGFFFAFGMLASSLKLSYELIAHVIPACLGSLRGIAKIIACTCLLLAEVIVPLFLYQFVAVILQAVPGIFEGSIESMFGHSTPILFAESFAVPLMSTYLMWIIAVNGIKGRSHIIKSLNEAATKLSEKFVALDDNPSNSANPSITPPKPSGGGGSGVGKALAGGATAGAGMAAASRLGKHDDGTNAGGLNSEASSQQVGADGEPPVVGGEVVPAGGGGPSGGTGGGDGPGGGGSGGGGNGLGLTGSSVDARNRASSAKSVAKGVTGQGGLSRIKAAAQSEHGRAAIRGAVAGGRSGGLAGAAAGAAGGAGMSMAHKKLGKSSRGSAGGTNGPAPAPTPKKTLSKKTPGANQSSQKQPPNKPAPQGSGGSQNRWVNPDGSATAERQAQRRKEAQQYEQQRRKAKPKPPRPQKNDDDGSRK